MNKKTVNPWFLSRSSYIDADEMKINICSINGQQINIHTCDLAL